MGDATFDNEQIETRQIKDVASARDLYARFKRNDEKRAKARATVRTALERGKPYNAKKMRDKGQSWRCNENFGGAEADRDEALKPYYDMANNTRRLISATIHDDESKAERWQSIFEENFDKFRREWKGYTSNFLKMAHELIDFGIGYPYFKDEHTARYESMPTGRILFPDETSTDIDKWDMICIEKRMTAPELFKYVRSPKAASRSSFMGWKPKNVKALIKHQAHLRSKPQKIFEWEELQTELISNDIFLSQDIQAVEVVILLVAQNDIEKDGIGAWIFPANPIETTVPGGAKLPNNPEDGFLFTRPRKYAKSWDQVLPAIFYEVGQGTVHSVKGFAIKNFALSALANRQECKLVDASSFSMALNLKRSGDKGSDGPPISSYGAVNVLPSDVEVVDFRPKISEAIATSEYLRSLASQNNRNFAAQNKEIAKVETLGQANLLAANSEQVSGSNAALFLDQLGGGLYSEMFRRLRSSKGNDPDAKKFKARCIKEGIPKNVFHTLEVTITAGNATGGANPLVRAAQSRQTFELLRNESRVDKDWLLENIIADTHGSRAVDKALLTNGQVSDEWDSRQAIMENDHMLGGVTIPVTTVDGHMAHLVVHVGSMDAAVKGFQASGAMDTPIMKMLQLLIPHTNEHFSLIENDDSVAEQRNILFGQFSNLQRQVLGIFNDIAAQANAQAQRDQDEFAAQNRNRLPAVSVASDSNAQPPATQ